MEQKYILLKDVKPAGYLQTKMAHDLKSGFVGKLPELVPQIMVEDDIYGENRRGRKIKEIKLGVAESDVEGSLQLQWWNSESQSNWLDGFIRHAFLVGNDADKKRARDYVKHLLATQDKDGYIGIYDRSVRYHHTFEAGDLWAQTTLFRALLGYYEFTHEKEVLQAVISATHVTMQEYAKDSSNPFLHEQSHGLTFVDILLWLYRYTKEEKYIEYGAWLYENFSNNEVGEYDVQQKSLLSEERFACHGVHTYEHLRGVLMHHQNKQTDTSKKLLDRYLAKFSVTQTPSGGVIGDEWIAEKIADSEMTGYEYCSLHETFHSLMELALFTGETKYIDQAEWLFWNAAQGARHPNRSAIAYLKSDDSYEMNGDFHFEVESVHQVQTRYKYSAVHQDAAVCCVPMAGRITPYYLNYAIGEFEDGLYQMLYGDMDIQTIYQDQKVAIKLRGQYPFETALNIEIESDVDFIYKLRIPKWATGVFVNGEKYLQNEIVLEVKKGAQTFNIVFEKTLLIQQTMQRTNYVTYGPLLYVLPLLHHERLDDKYCAHDFEDAYYTKVNDTYERAQLLKVELDNDQVVAQIDTGSRVETHRLVPILETILRKVTFKGE